MLEVESAKLIKLVRIHYYDNEFLSFISCLN
jgi:hypothetical protein